MTAVLEERLIALIEEHGPSSACWLAIEVRRRKAVVLAALRGGAFVLVGAGRSARWDIAPIPPEVATFRRQVWKARRSGALDPFEALELLIDQPAHLLARFAEVAA